MTVLFPQNGDTPLHEAALFLGNLDCVKALLACRETSLSQHNNVSILLMFSGYILVSHTCVCVCVCVCVCMCVCVHVCACVCMSTITYASIFFSVLMLGLCATWEDKLLDWFWPRQ